MFELFILLIVLWVILTFFYKQAICEFRLNQLEWANVRETLPDLMQEKAPIVLRGITQPTIWTKEDVLLRDSYGSIPLFKEMTLMDWIRDSQPVAACPWTDRDAERIAARSGLTVWAEKTLHTAFMSNALSRAWIHPRYYCWAGEVGLHRTFAMWTVILPVDGSIQVTIMPETMDAYLPAPPLRQGCHPSRLTRRDTPFVGDLKFMDVIVRPGTCLIMPPHWFVSWTAHDTEKLPMVCTVAYHTPISWLAYRLAPFK
jgi:hypothetical protein